MNKQIIGKMLITLNITLTSLFMIITEITNTANTVFIFVVIFFINYFSINKISKLTKLDFDFKNNNYIYSNLISITFVIFSIFYTKKYGIPFETKYDPVLELIILNLSIIGIVLILNTLVFLNLERKIQTSLKYFIFNFILIITSILIYLIIGSGLTVGDFS